MKLHRPAQTTISEPIIALVDVVFFLLVFFLLVARLDASAPFEVTPPIAMSGTDMPGGGVTLSVAVDGTLAVDGHAVGQANWLDRVIRAAEVKSVDLVRINAHAEADLRFVLPLLAALDDAQLGEVVVVVTPVAP